MTDRNRQLDRPYPPEEIATIARERLGYSLEKHAPIAAMAALLRVIERTLASAIEAGGPLGDPWSDFYQAIRVIRTDVDRILQPAMQHFSTTMAGVLGDVVLSWVRQPEPLPWIVELTCLGLELQRQAQRSHIEAGPADDWQDIRDAVTEMLYLASFGPVDTQPGERVH